MNTEDREEGVFISSSEMLSYMLEDIENNELGNSIPSTIGVDRFFIEDFVTEQMSIEFPYIEQDFLKHCYNKLEQFNEVGWYENCDHRFFVPEVSLEKRLFRLMYNGAKFGDEYCVELLKYLYRTFHKKEYNQLKRFSKLVISDVWSLADNGECFDFGIVARIIVMAGLFNIEMDNNCSLAYLLLEKKCNENNEEIRRLADGLDIPEKVLKESTTQVNEWVSQNVGVDGNIKMRVVKNSMKFINDYFVYENYPGDFVFSLLGDDTGVLTELVLALTILKTKHPKREYSFEDVQKYMMYMILASSVVKINEIYSWHLEDLLCSVIEDEELDPITFNPSNIKVRTSADT